MEGRIQMMMYAAMNADHLLTMMLCSMLVMICTRFKNNCLCGAGTKRKLNR